MKVICRGGSIVLSGENNGYAQKFQWTATPSGGTFSNNKILNPTYTPPQTFTGQISLKLISTQEPGNVNCPVVADEMILTVNAPATAVAGTAVTACSNSQLTLPLDPQLLIMQVLYGLLMELELLLILLHLLQLPILLVPGKQAQSL